MNTARPDASKPAGKSATTFAASAVLADGRLVELVHDRERGATGFVVGDGAACAFADTVEDRGLRLVPFPATHSILKARVVLFPEQPEEYGSTAELLQDLGAYIRRYVDLTPAFARLAAHYVLLSWVHDRFNELPYLRLRGDYGSGKTRFLLTVGAICYKPIFASGASTVAPLFHLLDAFAGTLLIDEADFRFSDQKAEIAKILNNGNARGFPVLRMESANGRVFTPRAFQVFGPKIVAMRGHFDDPALESRFLTETTGARPPRPDIPLSLPEEQAAQALSLRNRLLLYRLRTWHGLAPTETAFDADLEPRLKQIFAPLAAVAEGEEARRELMHLARACDRVLKTERGSSLEAQMLTAIRYLAEEGRGPVPLKELATLFARAFGRDYERQVTSRWVGGVVRRRLGLATHKSHGTFAIPLAERAKLAALYARYGVTADDADALAEAAAALPDRLRLERVEFGELGESGEPGHPSPGR